MSIRDSLNKILFGSQMSTVKKSTSKSASKSKKPKSASPKPKRRRLIRPMGGKKNTPKKSSSYGANNLERMKRIAGKIKENKIYKHIAPPVLTSPGNRIDRKGRTWKLIIRPNSKVVRVLKPGKTNASLPFWVLASNNRNGLTTLNYIRNMKRDAVQIPSMMNLADKVQESAAKKIQRKYRSYKKKSLKKKTSEKKKKIARR